MKRFCTTVAAVCAALLFAISAQAQVKMNMVPLHASAKDTVALARFYKTAFGMQEVRRFDGAVGLEIFLNFGATIVEAKANRSQPILIIPGDSDNRMNPTPCFVFDVKDMNATAAAIKAAGGSMAGKPISMGNILMGFATDPSGNKLELIQRPEGTRRAILL